MAKSSTKTPILVWMIFLSLALGVFISYFFVFVNALFISEIGTSKLPLAYILSGFGGTVITWLFNLAERKIGFGKAATLFCLFFALVMFGLWYFFIQEIQLKLLIFIAYSWFWVSINFTALVFWKLPSNLFDLSENKKYNGVISTGEVISAIIAYLSVPALLTLESFTRDKLLLISTVGITLFSLITFFLSKSIHKPTTATVKKAQKAPTKSSKDLTKEPFFRLIFLSVFLAVIIQLLIDFSLMEVSANQYSDPKELAKYFAFLFGGMRLLELILKTFVSKYIIKEYGVFISLSSLIFALAFVTIIGLSSLFIGYVGLILIVASLGKAFERSLYRSVYAPTINILYQAYPSAKRALTQNYADGFGKTIGQLIAAVLIYFVASLESFESKILILLLGILAILTAWFIVSKKLIVQYKLELSAVLKSIQTEQKPTHQSALPKMPTREDHAHAKEESTTSIKSGSASSRHSLLKTMAHLERLCERESSIKNGLKSTDPSERKLGVEKLDEELSEILSDLKIYNYEELLLLSNHLNSSTNKHVIDSKITPILNLIFNVELIKKTKNFNFSNFNKNLKTIDFLSSALIQNLAESGHHRLSNRDYFYLLEDRIHKYTYLLACLRDLGKSSPNLSKLIQAEAFSTQFEILSTLHFKHDPKSIDQIILMLYQNEKSQELIALELLELLLDEQEKKWILPLLREENPEKVLNKLEAEFGQASLIKEKRLISILSNTQMDIPAIIKSHAISELYIHFPTSENIKLIKTISRNAIDLMQYMAKTIVEDTLKDNPQKYPFPNYYKEFSSSETERFFQSEQSCTLSYLYWYSELNSDETQSLSDLYPLYFKLYQAAFPKEISFLGIHSTNSKLPIA